MQSPSGVLPVKKKCAGGGLWNSPKAPHYSKETQEMLKLMMQESRLTIIQQKTINNQLKNGGALPLVCNPASSAPSTQPKPRIIKPVGLTAKPQKRTAEKCSSGDNYTRERFRPSATRDLEQEKRKLQNLFALGTEQPKTTRCRDVTLEKGVGEEERDRFQEVLDEIEERKRFLEDMSALGRGKCYHNIINTEISQKIRELEMIDKARSMELKSLIQKETDTLHRQ